MLVIRFHIGIMYRVDQNHIYTEYIRYFGLEITKYTVYIYVYIRFWPPLHIHITQHVHTRNTLRWMCTLETRLGGCAH